MRTKIKLTHNESGDVQYVTVGTGHLMAVRAKNRAADPFVAAACMAYMAYRPEARRLPWEKLLDEATEFFFDWEYEEVGEPDAQEADGPLA